MKYIQRCFKRFFFFFLISGKDFKFMVALIQRCCLLITCANKIKLNLRLNLY